MDELSFTNQFAIELPRRRELISCRVASLPSTAALEKQRKVVLSGGVPEGFLSVFVFPPPRPAL